MKRACKPVIQRDIAAVDWVTRLVERGERGVPDLACRMLVTGTWREKE